MLLGFQYCTLTRESFKNYCLHYSEVLKVDAPLTIQSLQIALSVSSVYHYIYHSWKWLNKIKLLVAKPFHRIPTPFLRSCTTNTPKQMLNTTHFESYTL